MSDKLNVDDKSLKERAKGLSHIETKMGKAEMKSMLVCSKCNYTQGIPAAWEEMDNPPSTQKCGKCGGTMNVKLVHS